LSGLKTPLCSPAIYEAPFSWISNVLLLTIGGATKVKFVKRHLYFCVGEQKTFGSWSKIEENDLTAFEIAFSMDFLKMIAA
jgi:hypothetical protein